MDRESSIRDNPASEGKFERGGAGGRGAGKGKLGGFGTGDLLIFNADIIYQMDRPPRRSRGGDD